MRRRRGRRTGPGRAVRRVRRALGAGRAGAGHARLRAPLRLSHGAARAVGRHRLGAGRLHRRAGARAHATCSGVAMPSRYSSAGSLHATPRRWRGRWASTSRRSRSSRCSPRTWRPSARRSDLRAGVRAAAAAAADLTAQNLQARVRGAILMALSNRQDRLLLTTGNKSEVATGYCTLYGDMAGGLAVHQRRAEDAGLPARPRRQPADARRRRSPSRR